MSRVFRGRSSPAHRPTWLSIPSAPRTTFARTSYVPCIPWRRAPTTRPSSWRRLRAVVRIRISAPAFAASFARWRSNRSRSRMYPHSFPARASSTTRTVPSGATTFAPSTSCAMNAFEGSSPTSSSHRFATPSPHRTGVPISVRFSIISVRAPFRAAWRAAVLPEGPAPTTRTSNSSGIDVSNPRAGLVFAASLPGARLPSDAARGFQPEAHLHGPTEPFAPVDRLPVVGCMERDCIVSLLPGPPHGLPDDPRRVPLPPLPGLRVHRQQVWHRGPAPHRSRLAGHHPHAPARDRCSSRRLRDESHARAGPEAGARPPTIFAGPGVELLPGEGREVDPHPP